MKKFLSSAFLMLAFAVLALAQTPQEIVSRMEKEMDKHEKDGMSMVVDVKVPILGTMTSKASFLGDRCRIEASMMGVDIITWSDETSEWIYNSKSNEVEIRKLSVKTDKEGAAKAADGAGDVDLFSQVSAGYDVSIKKETANAWFILCKKKSTNTEKDAPKNIDLVIAKGSYYPVSLSTKMSGIALTMRDVKFGVSEKAVTFRPEDFPGITITDKR